MQHIRQFVSRLRSRRLEDYFDREVFLPAIITIVIVFMFRFVTGFNGVLQHVANLFPR